MLLACNLAVPYCMLRVTKLHKDRPGLEQCRVTRLLFEINSFLKLVQLQRALDYKRTRTKGISINSNHFKDTYLALKSDLPS